MKDQIVKLETAKLANEKGFDVNTDFIYDLSQKPPILNLYGEVIGDFELYVPTQSLLQKWLRRVHAISIKIDDFYYDEKIRYDYNVSKLGSQKDNPKGLCETYEEALEKGLQEALELIEK